MYSPELEFVFLNYNEQFVDEPNFFIRFYEDNAAIFAEVEWFDEENLFKYQAIAGRYLNALVQSRKDKKAITECPVIINTIEKNFKKLNIDQTTDSWYRYIILQSGIAKYHLRGYWSAQKDFKKLLLIDPNDKDLNLWVLASKYRYREQLWLFIGLIAFTICYGVKVRFSLSLTYVLSAVMIIPAITAMRYNYLAKKASSAPKL